jgi:hypothetical protein
LNQLCELLFKLKSFGQDGTDDCKLYMTAKAVVGSAVEESNPKMSVISAHRACDQLLLNLYKYTTTTIRPLLRLPLLQHQ